MEDADADLAVHYLSLAEEMDAAFAEYRQETRRIAPRLHARTQAGIIRDLTIRRMLDWCDRTRGATFIKKGQLSVIGLADRWLLRVKRTRGDFRVAVSPTGASEAYDQNHLPDSLQGTFLEEPEATCLYLAWYVPENAPTRLVKFIICNDEAGVRSWVKALDGEGLPPSAELDLGHPPLPPPSSEPPRRVRVRDQRKRKSNE